ncbi:Protein-serine/threonine phosphatase [Heracleum sosnowskyi]|uniref:protein-serine/threonine phosphatase n=1 Tax=Heracleum sosnowskyi TaxID=360622 RepID=A0AAD8N780_9APIA|nr:Protein-serine/threonine phosphatase [Heracleum sosnowskyi]
MSQHSASEASSQCPQGTSSSPPHQPRALPLFPVEARPRPLHQPLQLPLFPVEARPPPLHQPRPLSLFPVEARPPPLHQPRLLPLFPVAARPPRPQPVMPRRQTWTRTDPFCGSMSVIGMKQTMEDAVNIVPNLCLLRMQFSEECSMHFYAVFDGHVTNLVSGFCRAHMHEMLRKELLTPPPEIHGIPLMSDEWWRIIMMRSFRNMDQLVLTTCPCGVFGNNCGTHSTDPVHLELVGSTAAVVVLSNNQIIVANCGDSGVLLSHDGNPIPLTIAHKPDRQDERARIEALGGRITSTAEGGRTTVEHLFAKTRAIGTKSLKRYLIPDPEVVIRTRDAKDEFLIIATDGLWKAVPPSMACNVARACLGDSHPPFYANENDPYGTRYLKRFLIPDHEVVVRKWKV